MTWKVADVMTRDVVRVGPRASFKSCADLMRIHGVSALPVVVAGDRLEGIVSEDDLMRKVARVPERCGDPLTAGPKEEAQVAADLMTANVATASPEDSLTAAARLMFQRHVKRLPVVSSSNQLVGIVSRSDLLRVFLRSDESIRREVAQQVQSAMPLIGRGRIEPKVRDGVVQLHGEIEMGSLTDLLTRLVQGVPGVVGVESHLQPMRGERELEPAGSWRAGDGRA